MSLGEFKGELERLVKQKKITEDTANTYYSSMKLLMDACGGVLEGKKIKDYLSKKLNSKEQFNKYISALRKYEDEVLKRPKGILFGETEIELFSLFKGRVDTRPKKISISQDTIMRKINGLRNEKLKTALRLQVRSGLRVNEISNLKPEDIKFTNEEEIILQVIDGKGKKDRTVKVLRDDYLYKKLPMLVKTSQENKEERIFFHRNYLKLKASEIGIETHDLRRINARNRLEEEMKKGKSRKAAKEVIRKELGHESIKITDMYLRYKIKKK